MSEQNRPVPPAPLVHYPRPIVTLVLLGINLALFWWMETQGGSENTQVLQRFGALDPPLVWQGEYYRVLTAIFLHIGYVHLFSNMFALYLLGAILEPFYGHWRFVAIYLIAGVFGNAVSLLFVDGLSAGASGSILGLAGALLSRISSIKGRVPEPNRRVFFLLILLLIGLDVFLGFRMTHVNNGAHLGGLVGGWCFSFAVVLMHASPPWKRHLGQLLSGAFAVVFVATMGIGFFPFWSASFWAARGDLFLKRGDTEAAVRNLERAVERQEDPRALGWRYRFLAKYYYDRQELEKALRYGRRAAAVDPGFPYVHEWLERSYEHLGMKKEAEKEREIFLGLLATRLALRSQDPVDLNDLAYALAERSMLLERASQWAFQANQATGFRDPFLLDTLAWVLHRQGKHEQAEQYLRPIAENSDEPIYQYHLGAILIGRGEVLQGRELIQKAIQGGLAWYYLKEARDLLQSTQPTL